jgi:hypothetical protein
MVGGGKAADSSVERYKSAEIGEVARKPRVPKMDCREQEKDIISTVRSRSWGHCAGAKTGELSPMEQKRNMCNVMGTAE